MWNGYNKKKTRYLIMFETIDISSRRGNGFKDLTGGLTY